MKRPGARRQPETCEPPRKVFSSILRSNRKTTDALAKLAEILAKLAENDKERLEALDTFEQVLRRDPRREDVRRQAATLAFDLKQFPEAVVHLEALAAAHPDEVGLCVTMARCLESGSKYDDAARQYELAIRDDPQLIAAYVGFAAMAAAHPGRYHRGSDPRPTCGVKRPFSGTSPFCPQLHRAKSDLGVVRQRPGEGP